MPRPICLLALLALAGCGPRDAAPGPIASLDRYVVGWASAPPDARPAGAAEITPVLPGPLGPFSLTRRQVDGIGTVRTFMTRLLRPGGSTDTIVVRAAPTAAGGSAGTGDWARPSEAGIRGELAARFPGTEMRVVARPARNGHGPYGLAVGRDAGGLNCVYAWQWIEGGEAARLGAAAVTWRASTCRSRETFDVIAAAFDRLALTQVAAPRPRRESERPAGPRTVRADRPQEQPRPRSWAPATAALSSRPGERVYLVPLEAESPRRPGLATTSAEQLPARTSDLTADLPSEALRGPGATRAAAGVSSR